MKILAGVGLFLVGCVVGWSVTLYWLHPPADSSSSASWVQAVGSIAAIAAAFVVMYVQRHLEQGAAAKARIGRKRMAQELAALVVRNAIQDSVELATLYEIELAHGDMHANAIEVLIDTRGRFDAISLTDLGNDHAVFVENARACLTKLISVVRKWGSKALASEQRSAAVSEIRMVTKELGTWLKQLEESGVD